MKIAINGKLVEISSAAKSIANCPIGSIVAWSGTENDIPDGWHICNGEDGTLWIQKTSITLTDYATIEDVKTTIRNQIEEYDTDDGWHIRLWSNGYVEMSGIFTETVASDMWTTWGQIYVVSAGKIGTYQYPVTLQVKYSEQHTVGCSSGAAVGNTAGPIDYLDRTGQYGLIRGTSSGAMTIARSFFITGIASQTQTVEIFDSVTDEETPTGSGGDAN